MSRKDKASKLPAVESTEAAEIAAEGEGLPPQEGVQELPQEATEPAEENGQPQVYEVRTPNHVFAGNRFGVKFQDGVGRTADPIIASDLSSLGYDVRPKPPVVERPKAP